MSNHEFEDFIEQSIRLLHEHDTTIDHRSAFIALWKFQEQGDCGFTHFRVMPILLERRAAYRFSKEVHPAIDALEGVNRDLGYVDDTFLYCDAGSTLWKQLRDELSAEDRIEPVELPLTTVGQHVLRAAEKVNDVDTIAMWSRFLKVR